MSTTLPIAVIYDYKLEVCPRKNQPKIQIRTASSYLRHLRNLWMKKRSPNGWNNLNPIVDLNVIRVHSRSFAVNKNSIHRLRENHARQRSVLESTHQDETVLTKRKPRLLYAYPGLAIL